MEAVVELLVKQVPSLIVLVWVVHKFLTHMADRDRAYLADRQEVNLELKNIAENLHTLCHTIEKRDKDACRFHEEFGGSLRRIEATVTRNTND